ncbi:hypothetical protein ACFE04_013340 [Oxalis oulophora]
MTPTNNNNDSNNTGDLISAKTVIKCGLFLIGALVFQTVYVVWVMEQQKSDSSVKDGSSNNSNQFLFNSGNEKVVLEEDMEEEKRGVKDLDFVEIMLLVTLLAAWTASTNSLTSNVADEFAGYKKTLAGSEKQHNFTRCPREITRCQ